MCHLCSGLSRRHFVQVGLATGLVVWLAGCGIKGNSAVSSPPLQKKSRTAPDDLPTWAGQITAVHLTTLTLRSPLQTRQFTLAAKAKAYDPLENPIEYVSLQEGMSVALWLNEGEIIKIQQLPPLAVTPNIPTDLPQPAPTGEVISFGPLLMVNRAGWGAAEPQLASGGEAGLYHPTTNPTGWFVYPEPLADRLTTLVVHHSALELYHGPREIQALHIREKGFADVGYHFFIDSFGQLYQGRALNVRGAHTGGFNTGSVGICLLGNFELMPPLTAQLDTLQMLATYLRDTYTITHVAGHRDFQPDQTVCPGQNLWPLLSDFSTKSGLTFGTTGYVSPQNR